MMAIPIGYDQFGVANRIAYHGVGEFLEVDDLTIDGLHELIQKVVLFPRIARKRSTSKTLFRSTAGSTSLPKRSSPPSNEPSKAALLRSPAQEDGPSPNRIAARTFCWGSMNSPPFVGRGFQLESAGGDPE
jgi:hypothetical protein